VIWKCSPPAINNRQNGLQALLKHTKELKPQFMRKMDPIERFNVYVPARAEICIEISAPPAPPSEFSYDEYTDRTLSVGI